MKILLFMPLIISLLTTQVERDTVYTPIKPKPFLIRDTIMVVIKGEPFYYELKKEQKKELLKPFEARFDGQTYILRRIKNEKDTSHTK